MKQTFTREEVIELIENAICSPELYEHRIINDGDEDDPSWDDMGAEINEEEFDKWIKENL